MSRRSVGGRPRTDITPEQREELVAAEVTLNGNRAKIGGTRNDFATVTDITTRLSAEWSWDAVARVVANGGRFTS